MNILAIDTVTPMLSIAAEGPCGLVTQTFTGASRSHAEKLIPLIDLVVAQAGFTTEHIDMILCPQGPGSFTGLRLGYSVAKALQLSSGSVFIPIPTLACIAQQYASWKEGLAVVIDAKRNRFYTQLFKSGEPITQVSDTSVEEILPLFSQSDQWLVTGYGTSAFQTALSIANNADYFYFIETAPICFAHSMITYAQQNSDILPKAADYDGPLYIRKSDAEKD